MSADNLISRQTSSPQVSFAMACFNAQPYLRSAIEAALSQTDISVEILVVDDGSSDSSLAEAQAIAAADPRVRVFQTHKNGGPAAARNVALTHMRGDWFAILDSDDLVDPARSTIMIEMAEEQGADLIADNLLVFGEGQQERPFFKPDDFGNGRWLEIDEYFARSQLFGSSPGPGFLKPMIRKSVIDRLNIRYNEGLRIGEDDELIVRILYAECRYYLCPETSYHYRKHAGSISHRLSSANAQKMLAAEVDIRDMIGPKQATSKAYKQRFDSVERGLAFVTSIDQLKAGDLIGAMRTLARCPSAILLYRMPIAAALGKLLGRS